MFFLKFSSGPANMWDRGKFGTMVTRNSTSLYDPWAGADDRNAPFDQEFFLILNVAVGGTVRIASITILNDAFANCKRRTATGQIRLAINHGQTRVMRRPKSSGKPRTSGWIPGVKVTSAV